MSSDPITESARAAASGSPTSTSIVSATGRNVATSNPGLSALRFLRTDSLGEQLLHTPKPVRSVYRRTFICHQYDGASVEVVNFSHPALTLSHINICPPAYFESCHTFCTSRTKYPK